MEKLFYLERIQKKIEHFECNKISKILFHNYRISYNTYFISNIILNNVRFLKDTSIKLHKFLKASLFLISYE